MRDFRQWIDQRIEEAIASPRLIREVGEGIWISPSDEVFKFKDLTHAEWAKTAELDVSEMLVNFNRLLKDLPDDEKEAQLVCENEFTFAWMKISGQLEGEE